jgi:hypothetical protein
MNMAKKLERLFLKGLFSFVEYFWVKLSKNGAPERCLPWVGSELTRKHQTRHGLPGTNIQAY